MATADGAARPRFAELPVSTDAPAHSAWGLYGPDDDLGTLNLLTPARVVAAAGCIRTGKRFTVGLPLDLPAPPFFGREAMQHTVISLAPGMLDDKLDNYFPQGSTQWDAICHFGHAARFYNGRTEEENHGEVHQQRMPLVSEAPRDAAPHSIPAMERFRLAPRFGG